MKRINRLAASYLLLAASSSAEIQTQHVFDTSVKRNRFEVLGHFRARTKPEGGGCHKFAWARFSSSMSTTG